MVLPKFETYQLAVQLYRGCQKVAVTGHVKDQLLRAALSIVLNLAESSAKPTAKERRRFYSIALASTREVQVILDLVGHTELMELSDRVGACAYRLVYPAV